MPIIDYSRKREDVPADEERNWPKGASKSSHEFMDLDQSPIVNRQYWNNEEIAYLVRFRRDEILQGIPGFTSAQFKNAEKQAKVDILDSIYPLVNLHTFREDNPKMRDKCCRLIFELTLDSIASCHFVHGEALRFYNNTVGEDIDLSIPADPKWGWDLTKPEEGFPCINLTPSGCPYHNVGPTEQGKPDRCNKYPYVPKDLHLISTCSYSFTEISPGVWEVQGSCNRCK